MKNKYSPIDNKLNTHIIVCCTFYIHTCS